MFAHTCIVIVIYPAHLTHRYIGRYGRKFAKTVLLDLFMQADILHVDMPKMAAFTIY